MPLSIHHASENNFYDSDSDDGWLSAYNSQKNGDPSMYKERSINILDSFDPGDEILIRFNAGSIDWSNSVQEMPTIAGQ